MTERKTLSLVKKTPAEIPMLKRTGIIRYDPIRKDFKKTHKTHTMTVEFPRDDFDLYYQWYLRKLYGIRIQRPMYGTHMTIVSGNERIAPQYRHNWKKYEGMKVDVYHGLDVIQDHVFWYLNVYHTESFSAMRAELGLSKCYKSVFHVTIGRNFEN